MSFTKLAEKELTGQKGSLAHFWNQETEDSTSYFPQNRLDSGKKHKIPQSLDKTDMAKVIKKVSVLLQFWELFGALGVGGYPHHLMLRE